MVVELSGAKLPLTASTATPRHWMFPLKKASGLSGAARVNRQPRSNPLGSDGRAPLLLCGHMATTNTQGLLVRTAGVLRKPKNGPSLGQVLQKRHADLKANSQMDAVGRSPEEDCNGTMSDPLLQEEQHRLLTGRRPEGLGASPIALKQTRTHSSRCRCRYAQLVVVRLSSGRLDPRFSCRMNTAGLSSMCTNHTLISQHIVGAHRYPGPSPESPARRLPAEEMRNVYRLRNPKQSTYIPDIFCATSGSHNLDEATLLVGR